jgi:NADPH:quinone reductase-like Zn-dependent oxidoreductase
LEPVWAPRYLPIGAMIFVVAEADERLLVAEFGLTDWYRDGSLAEYAAVETRNLAPLPGDVDVTVGASLPISGLHCVAGTLPARPPSGGAERARARRGRRSRVDGDAART